MSLPEKVEESEKNLLKKQEEETPEAGASSSAAEAADPLPDLLKAWNGAGMGKVLKLTPGRRTHARARLSEAFFRGHYPEALQRLSQSAFCRGENDRGWRADFDWFIKPDTLPKILEGKYDNKSPGSANASKRKARFDN